MKVVADLVSHLEGGNCEVEMRPSGDTSLKWDTTGIVRPSVWVLTQETCKLSQMSPICDAVDDRVHLANSVVCSQR